MGGTSRKRPLSSAAALVGCTTALLGASLTLASSASADHRFDFAVPMSGGEMAPPNASTGTGAAAFTMDTAINQLSFSYSFSGLSGSPVAAHIHGFAPPGATAPPLFTLPASTPTSGYVYYEESQEANLLAGLAYIDIHTTTFLGGEIRGQIDEPSPQPHPDTRIDSGPVGPVVTPDVTFTYSGIPAEDADHFECRLDGGSLEPCPDTGRSYAGLADGEHEFAVIAGDAVGNEDLTPATRSFTVDTELRGAKLQAKRTQRQRKRIRIRAKASADEAVALLANGMLKIKGRRKAIKLNPQRRPARAGETVQLILKPARKKDQRKALATLQAGRRVAARVAIRFSDAAGNQRTFKAKIGLR